MTESEPGAIEETLVQINECHVFKLPPRQQASGYRAAEWENNHLWTGRCRVIAIGSRCEVRLEDRETGKIFAVCPVNTAPNAPKAIEPVVDSSRYFVLRIEDPQGGKHAYIGVGFQQRSEAFDFNVALQDHVKYVERLSHPTPDLSTESQKDYSMKQGETIKVNIKVKTKDGRVVEAGPRATPATSSTGAGSLLLPPPGTKSQKPQPPPSSSPAVPAVAPSHLDAALFGDFHSGISQPPPPPQQQQQQPPRLPQSQQQQNQQQQQQASFPGWETF